MNSQKTYTLQDIKSIFHWVEYRNLHKFLLDNGITPVTEIRTGKRVWRAYDQSAYDKASVMRDERRRHRELERIAHKQQSSTAPTTMRRASTKELRAHIAALSKKVDVVQATLNDIHAQLSYRRAA